MLRWWAIGGHVPVRNGPPALAAEGSRRRGTRRPVPYSHLHPYLLEPPVSQVEPKPVRRKSGGKAIRIAAGVAVLLATVACVIVIKNKDRTEPEQPSDPLPATYKNSLGMEFVKVPKGTGWLGGGGGKQGETKVVFEQDFYLGKYEVTQGE